MIRLVFTGQMRERLRHERLHHPHPRVRQRLFDPLLATDPRRPAPTQRAGGFERTRLPTNPNLL